jgi:putative membrane protein insertion efficiency factor
MLAKAAIAAIRLYQLTLSRILPSACRFTPSCSQYALEAYRKHGFVRGTGLSVWRVLRCNPFNKGGFDPVP